MLTKVIRGSRDIFEVSKKPLKSTSETPKRALPIFRLFQSFLFIFLLAIGIPCPHLCYGYGLRTGFGKVILENVPIGKIYSMRKDAKFPLVIKNESDKQIELKLEVLIPEENEVQDGYEAIPDAGWITLEKDSFIVEPGGEAETDVIISVPNNKEYLGRRFHVFIWSHTIGESLGIGIKSKLLFHTEEAEK